MTLPVKLQTLAQWEARNECPPDEDYEDLEDEAEQERLDARHESMIEMLRQAKEDRDQQRFFDGQ